MVPAVARIDKRDACMLGCEGCRAFAGVSHGDDVRIFGDRADGVGQAFSLGGAAGIRFRKTEHAAAESQHGGFKTQTRPCAGFIKQCGQDLSVTAVGVVSRVFDDVLCEPEDFIQLLRREIHGIHEIAVFQHTCPLFPKKSLPFREGCCARVERFCLAILYRDAQRLSRTQLRLVLIWARRCISHVNPKSSTAPIALTRRNCGMPAREKSATLWAKPVIRPVDAS